MIGQDPRAQQSLSCGSFADMPVQKTMLGFGWRQKWSTRESATMLT
jgi:hypothetical protein